MNRKWKFTGFVLASALLLGSTGTFLVGCKDYDDDISHLQQQIDANKKAIEGIEAQIKAGAILTKVESDGAGGVKVTLSNGQTYHIEKGAKGEDGVAPGSPLILPRSVSLPSTVTNRWSSLRSKETFGE